MSTHLGRAGQMVSDAEMARDFGAKLDEITSGDAGHLVIVEDNRPVAVMMGVDTYQAMRDEIEDLRADRLAIERLATLNERSLVNLESLEAQFRSFAM